MISWLASPLRTGLKVLIAEDTNGQIAAGVALGVMIGLLPKATLLAVLLGVLLCALRVNKAAGLLTASMVSALAPLADGFTHRLGLKVLTIPSLQPTFASFYDAPLGPWWGLHNSVVCGSLLLGIYLSYPTYLITRGVAGRLRPRFVRWAMKYRLTRWLLGADTAGRVGSAFGLGV